ncbi:unnamed protein product, partial [Sphenostylis stenocarpa]
PITTFTHVVDHQIANIPLFFYLNLNRHASSLWSPPLTLPTIAAGSHKPDDHCELTLASMVSSSSHRAHPTSIHFSFTKPPTDVW